MREKNIMRKARDLALDLLCMVVGSIIYAVGVNGFTAPNNIAPGGVTGVATMLNYLFDTPIGTVILVINIPIILWAIVEIGYKLVAKTMVAIVLNSVMIDVVALFMPAYHGDALIITLIGGVCEGVGLSLVFMRGATDRRYRYDRPTLEPSPAPSPDGQADACGGRLHRTGLGVRLSEH